ncbi:MAG: hypothetical protein WBQ57_00095 [Rhodanobacteraceae bacterium]
MRYLVCLIIGLAIGALTATTVQNVLLARDVWPRSIMQVMQHELAGARHDIRARHCADADLESSFAHLALLSGDIEPAVQPEKPPDRIFANHVARLRQAIAMARATGSDCERRLPALAAIGEACDACHRDYR